MALRTKTLWFATEKSDAAVADAVVTNLPQITVYAENSSRTFRSVLVWLGFSGQSTATGNTITEHRCGVSVNSATYTTVAETDDIGNSGENVGGIIGPFDFTSHFTSNFPAANSATLDIQVYFDVSTGTGLTTANVSALIAITYEFNDSAATQYATAIIPMESLTGALGTAEAQIGTNQIPQLTNSGGFFENVANFSVLQQFFVVEGNAEAAGGTGASTLNVRIDTGTTHSFLAETRTLGSDIYQRFIHIEAPATNAVHQWKAWCTTTGIFNHITHTMYVTYSFTIAGTTEFLNSILIPFELPSPMGGTTSADTSRFERTIYVEEPTTITLKQSAVRLHFVAGAGNLGGLNLRVGSQAFRAYTNNVSMVCGGSALQQRIDSGGAQGAGITLARGKNTITIDCYRTDSTDLGWNISGVIILNYKSGVSSQGIGSHHHTTIWKILDWDAALTSLREASAIAPDIPDSNWWATAIGYYMLHWDAAAANGIQWMAEVKAGEGSGDGWRDLYADLIIKDAERACQIIYCRARDDFQRYPQDLDMNRLVLETARKYRYANVATCAKGLAMILSYHSIIFTISGDVTGSSGGTVDIDGFQEDGDNVMHVGSTSRSGNGAYSIPWYDNTIDCFAEARESGILIGRSDNSVALGNA